ncbi:MAG TPA: spermidine/putrescine ABC transporter substrate-binding protein [Solirubrobacteraceae bacterium]|nr:spermidine/putrescine ABC transporter substrate-binding protein [Solirubrobacteraceae bacterium]
MEEPVDRSVDLDPALLRGLTEPRLTRRQALRIGGAGVGALSVGALLSACGVAGSASKNTKITANGVGSAAWWKKQKQAGVLDFANWPLYIDTSHGKHPSLEQFTKATGIKVNYFEVIQNNAPFYAQIAPTLRAGQSIGYDLVVLTSNSFQLAEILHINRWAIPLDHSRLPNFAKYAGPLVKNPSFDPGNEYTAAWQSGFTGIAYNPELTGREITSVHDLWDPKFKGHVGMMSDNTELGSVGMLALGIDPATSTTADWHKAAKLLKQQQSDGLVRQYYDQSYIKALENGDTWITQAWSGDIYQANNSGYPHLKFVVPKEGVMIWTDNMLIPLHAKHPVDALEWMNFYYQPKIAAEVADWVDYITPVPDAKPILLKQDPPVGKSPLVFPNAATNQKVHQYYTFKGYSDFQHWNNVFEPIIQA